MPLFCTDCNNLLTVVTSSDDFKFKCTKCEKIEDPTDEDSLRYEFSGVVDFTLFVQTMANAVRDPVNPKVEKDCTCGNNRAKQVRLGKELKLVNICDKCHRQWLEGTEEPPV